MGSSLPLISTNSHHRLPVSLYSFYLVEDTSVNTYRYIRPCHLTSDTCRRPSHLLRDFAKNYRVIDAHAEEKELTIASFSAVAIEFSYL